MTTPTEFSPAFIAALTEALNAMAPDLPAPRFTALDVQMLLQGAAKRAADYAKERP